MIDHVSRYGFHNIIINIIKISHKYTAYHVIILIILLQVDFDSSDICDFLLSNNREVHCPKVDSCLIFLKPVSYCGQQHCYGRP